MMPKRVLDHIARFLGYVLLLLFVLQLFAAVTAQDLPAPQLNLPSAAEPKAWNGAKTAGVALIVLGSLADGAVEGFEFDGRTAFERKFGASPNGFWGSQSWRSAYVDGNPENGFKSPLHKLSGAFDFYHVADDVRWLGYINGGTVFGFGMRKSKQKWWRTVGELVAVAAISSAAKRVGMEWIRD